MKSIYLLGGICVGVIMAYFAGAALGRAKCMENVARQAVEITKTQMMKKEKINAEVYSLGVADIRDILRTKYTIAD